MTPKRRSTLVVLFILIGGLAIAAIAFVNSMAQPSATLANGGNLASNPHALYTSAYSAYSLTDFTTSVGNGMVVGRDYHHDTTTIPLRDMPQQAPQAQPKHQTSPRRAIGIVHKNAPDGALVQHTLAPNAMPAPILNFDGIAFPGVNCGCAPPDTNGAVGATQYVQDVNDGYQVFDKSTGTSLLGPNDIATVWTGFGGLCETSGAGDPVVLYDKLANRWLLSQFAGGTTVTDECVAISATNDATGTWHRYGFHLGSNFFDYPKLGTWPDAYYMSMNIFDPSGTNYLGPQPFAFDRTAMLAGNSATFVSPVGPLGSTIDPLMPADIDGANLPTSGAPETFVRFPGAGHYDIYHFHVDFITPANSTFTLFASPTAAAFTQLCPNTSACVPELGATTSDYVDGLADRFMFRGAYRKFADGHEALVTNYTVSSNNVAGVRWIELDNITAGPVTVAQESTYQPDTTWRWMASAAMDHMGDIAVGFSASSTTIFPQIRYAGRLVTDPPNMLSQGEATLFSGTGSQLATSNRWGDYSDMTVDPVDDCTYWYTQEYYLVTAADAWHTRIGNFKFPSCSLGTPTPTITPGGPTLTPTDTGTPTPTSTITPTATITPIPTATPCLGVNTVVNGGFETGTFAPWVVSDTNPTPMVVTTQTHSGTYAAVLGTVTGTVEPLGDGSIYQTVAVPAGGAQLSYWYWPLTHDTISFDWQDAYVESITGTILSTVMHVDQNTQTWTNKTFDMTPYAGQTVRIVFLVHQDGFGDVTGMYVDDVSLATVLACASPTSTVTNTPAVTNTPIPSVTPTDCPNPFTDITGNIFYTAIHYLNCRGVVNGTDATHYSPAGTSTRGQFAKVVVLGFGTPFFTPTNQDFVDVPPSYFAYVYIESGFHAGILSGFDPATCTSHGVGNPCYLPNLPITRGQLTKLVVNAGGYTLITPTGGVPDFVDVPPSNVFYVSIETAYHNGVVNGYPGHLFLPNQNIRRDQMAQIVYTGILNRPH